MTQTREQRNLWRRKYYLLKRDSNREKRKISDKACRNRRWVKNHPNEIRLIKINIQKTPKEYSKEYYQKNSEKVKIRNRKYDTENKDKIKIRVKNYNNIHKEQRKINIKRWRSRHRGILRGYKDKRRRDMGNNLINNWFEGCHRHHINIIDVICIPAYLHKLYRHNHKKPETMIQINKIAFEYLTQNIKIL